MIYGRFFAYGFTFCLLFLAYSLQKLYLYVFFAQYLDYSNSSKLMSKTMRRAYIAPQAELFITKTRLNLLSTFSLEGDVDGFTPGGEVIEDSWDDFTQTP